MGAAGTDAVVESEVAGPLRCSHFDAFRFFSDDAAPRNAGSPSRATQQDWEQPGCLHANMDLYKWSYKLSPLIESELLLDCLELAAAAREIDMRASPYDLRGYGYTPIAVEQAAGRAEYVRCQKAIAARAAPLRAALLARCDLLCSAPGRVVGLLAGRLDATLFRSKRRRMMTDRVSVGNLRVAQVLYDFINTEALPGTDIDPDSFWAGVDKVVTDLAPQNQDLLARRDQLQAQIDKWHRHHVIEPIDPETYRQFLTEIGYLIPEPDDFTITTAGVDPEITTTAGPQLVVPVTNARFALNAANARWGSLYDALYGTDVIPETDGAEQGTSYNKVRGDKVIAYARKFLDDAVPLSSGSWADATGLSVDDGRLLVSLRGRRTVPRAGQPRPVRRLHRRARPPRLVRVAGQPRAAHRDPDRPRIADR